MSTKDDQATDHYQTGRSHSSAEISRKVKGRRLEPTANVAGLYEQLIGELARFEHEQATARNAVTSSTLATLARDYDRTDTDTGRAMLAADVAEGISLAEARTIRRAAAAVQLGTPGIIARAAADGMTPNEIARELGATGSYVRRILRENPTMLAEAAEARAEATD
ncbi:hypothetical protein [Streptomyces sp. NBC_01180]|uniref:hypothetical protein n=1 Tax=Streptomyces sp. NBC_01180 TaxID=2903763 RepID=UPI0038680833|nr:hypothetical protein OG708_17705 [Streptomyces sp. NBC_01180]